MTLKEIHEWVFECLGFCGCGDPQGAIDFLKSVLLAIKKRHDDNNVYDGDEGLKIWIANSNTVDDLIGMDVNAPLAWSYLYHLSDLDLLEHGGNCSGSWLTERGHQILDALEKYPASIIIDYEPHDDEILDANEIAV